MRIKSLMIATALICVLAACGVTEDGVGQVGADATAPGLSLQIDPGGELDIPMDGISETPTYYTFTVDGVVMEVVALKTADGGIRTAYNTCQVCSGSPKAYFAQTGDTLQCQNCGNKFPLDKVGLEKNGCNPAPIVDEDKTVTDAYITISYNVLSAGKGLFTNWKKGL